MQCLEIGAVPHNAIRQHNYCTQCFTTKPTDKNYHIKPRKILEYFLFPSTFCSFSKRVNKNNNNKIASFRTFERCSRSKTAIFATKSQWVCVLFFTKGYHFKKTYESCRRSDFSTPSGSSDRPDLSFFVNEDNRAHWRLWPFPWPDEVMRGGRQVELVGDIRRGEVVHFVVINDAGRGRHYLGTETTTENNLHRLKDTTKTDFQWALQGHPEVEEQPVGSLSLSRPGLACNLEPYIKLRIM